MNSLGQVDQETVSRIEAAYRLHRHKEFQLILLSGWGYRRDCDCTLAHAMYNYVRLVYPDMVKVCWRQTLSRDTVGDAFFGRILLELFNTACAGVETSVMTSPYHGRRCEEVFKLIYPSVVHIYKSSFVAPKEVDDHEVVSLKSFFDTFQVLKSSRIEDIYDIMVNRHPYYNGKIFPRLESLDILRKRLIEGR